MRLDECLPGQTCRIIDITLEGVDLQRLLDLGFHAGTQIRVLRNAPLRDPLDVQLRGYRVAIRRNVARGVQVEFV